MRPRTPCALAALALMLGPLGCAPDDPPVVSENPASDSETETLQDPATVDGARAVHRITIDQLARSIPVITGGISWTEDFGEGPVDMLQILSGTLGAPDYVRVTRENMEPSLIIAKFMTDAAHRICAKWVVRDRDLPSDERTLVVHDDWDSLDPDDVGASLRQLQLRFFSRRVAPDDEAPIADLRALFEAASGAAPATKEADDGWFAVCIGMMTDPEFVLY